MDKAAPMAPNLDVWNTLAMPTHQGGQGEGCTHCRAAWGPGGGDLGTYTGVALHGAAQRCAYGKTHCNPHIIPKHWSGARGSVPHPWASFGAIGGHLPPFGQARRCYMWLGGSFSSCAEKIRARLFWSVMHDLVPLRVPMRD